MPPSRKRDILTRAICAAAVFALAFPGPTLPVTAIMVCVLGSGIFLHRYHCMAGQPARLWYLVVSLLWLWGNTGINLSNYFTNASLSLSLLGCGIILSMSGGGLSMKQRWQRLGAFMFPVGFLALIPYALRASATGTVLTNLAIILLSLESVCSIIGAAWPGSRTHSKGAVELILLLMLSCAVAACSFGGQVAPGIQLIFGIFWPVSLPVLVWGRSISDYFQRSCGIQAHAALCALSALAALAPLGIMCYAYNLFVYFH